MTRPNKNPSKIQPLQVPNAPPVDELDLQRCFRETRETIAKMDDWVERLNPDSGGPAAGREVFTVREMKQDAIAILFLGSCSGTWAARTRYRGHLPGFGGFMINALGTRILVDPGPTTFSSLLSQDLHPAYLDAVVVTHAHWDCVHDLPLVLMAACGVPKEQRKAGNKRLRLYADSSVIYGHQMNSTEVLDGIKAEGDLDPAQMDAIPDLAGRLQDFCMMVPGAVNIHELFVRLRGRFIPLKYRTSHALGERVTLHIRRSFHGISYGSSHIPALDFVIPDGHACTGKRIVYLSDSEYRKELADEYAADLDRFGPIDVLICNVKTLNVHEYQSGPRKGFTKRHLGWNGLVQLTKDLRNKGVLHQRSLVVLRAWGIETVTVLDEGTGGLLAAPEKMEVYQKMYTKQTSQPGMIPGITWVALSGEGNKDGDLKVTHRRVPFYSRGEIRQFGLLYYCTRAMHHVVRASLAATDNLDHCVLISGETGTGKDVLAKAIHAASFNQGKRANHKAIFSPGTVTGGVAWNHLVGHERGAYTSADQDSQGLFQAAKGGTLIIQDIHNMSWKDQGHFLTVLEERKYQRTAGSSEYDFDAQVIATTNGDMTELTETGTFREDLQYRFQRKIFIPPLRERVADIPAILEGWRREGTKGFHDLSRLDSESLICLQNYHWPGNVRQLEAVIREIQDSGDWSRKNIEKCIEHNDLTAHRPSHKKGLKTGSSAIAATRPRLQRDILGILANAEELSRRDLQTQLEEKNGEPVHKSTINAALRKLIAWNLIIRIGAGPITVYRIRTKTGTPAH